MRFLSWYQGGAKKHLSFSGGLLYDSQQSSVSEESKKEAPSPRGNGHGPIGQRKGEIPPPVAAQAPKAKPKPKPKPKAHRRGAVSKPRVLERETDIGFPLQFLYIDV